MPNGIDVIVSIEATKQVVKSCCPDWTWTCVTETMIAQKQQVVYGQVMMFAHAHTSPEKWCYANNVGLQPRLPIFSSVFSSLKLPVKPTACNKKNTTLGENRFTFSNFIEVLHCWAHTTRVLALEHPLQTHALTQTPTHTCTCTRTRAICTISSMPSMAYVFLVWCAKG